jgi:hypothetical protein
MRWAGYVAHEDFGWKTWRMETTLKN